jgi:heparan sulfate N-deacetylase/N-sulfotransferase NDST2
VQIDIDDIFVGATGTRMVEADVFSLIRFQEEHLNRFVFNVSSSYGDDVYKFKFNLGFSGYYYQSGNDKENKGDQLLVENSNRFNWFDHSWSHTRVNILNSSSLRELMYYNYNFALEHHLKTDSFYSVSPHHSGIYPVNEILYTAWKEIWQIKATSTEGYPHLRPSFLRRGFIHSGIMVVPRSTCGIYTHTIFFSSYPNGGKAGLNAIINGGDLFKQLVYNQVTIFMTHMTNYANDKLALYLFENLFGVLAKWTHLRFISLAPVDLAQKYFELNPREVEPVWTNMCDDKRHMNMVYESK